MPYPTLHLHLSGLPRESQQDSPKLEVQPGALPALELSFEQLSERLSRLDRLYFEPDGSFVWAGGTLATAWQLDGMLYDHAGCVQRVELKGSCPVGQWHAFLACLGWPEQQLLAFEMQERRFLSVNDLGLLWQ